MTCTLHCVLLCICYTGGGGSLTRSKAHDVVDAHVPRDDPYFSITSCSHDNLHVHVHDKFDNFTM